MALAPSPQAPAHANSWPRRLSCDREKLRVNGDGDARRRLFEVAPNVTLVATCR
jgi:hypothetical protein